MARVKGENCPNESNGVAGKKNLAGSLGQAAQRGRNREVNSDANLVHMVVNKKLTKTQYYTYKCVAGPY